MCSPEQNSWRRRWQIHINMDRRRQDGEQRERSPPEIRKFIGKFLERECLKINIPHQKSKYVVEFLVLPMICDVSTLTDEGFEHCGKILKFFNLRTTNEKIYQLLVRVIFQKF